MTRNPPAYTVLINGAPRGELVRYGARLAWRVPGLPILWYHRSASLQKIRIAIARAELVTISAVRLQGAGFSGTRDTTP